MSNVTTSPIQAIVFDFDGTLVDSLKVKYDARFDLFASETPEVRAVAAEVIPQMRGNLRGEIIRAILAQTHPTLEAEAFEEKVLHDINRYDDLVENRIVEQGLFPGALHTLEHLGGMFALYVNSGTPNDALRRLLQRLDIESLFTGAYGIHPSRTDSASVMKQQNLKEIIAREGGDAGRVLVVGDGMEDYESACMYGCGFVGIHSERSDWSQGLQISMIKGVRDLASHPFCG